MLEHSSNRTASAETLLHDFGLRDDQEYFADTANRREFLTTLTASDFLRLTEHVNARMRGHEPYNKETAGEHGVSLPMLATPEAGEKQEALVKGFEEIKSYLALSEEDDSTTLRSVGMAMEALLIWVHPFNDGNGRTSRFFGKFIEDGTSDIDALIDETATNDNRQRSYETWLRIDKGNMVKARDLMLNDAELNELQATQMHVPDGIALSINRLLHDTQTQQSVLEYQASLKFRRAQALARRGLRAA